MSLKMGEDKFHERKINKSLKKKKFTQDVIPRKETFN